MAQVLNTSLSINHTFLKSNSTILAPVLAANRRASILFSGPSIKVKTELMAFSHTKSQANGRIKKALT